MRRNLTTGFAWTVLLSLSLTCQERPTNPTDFDLEDFPAAPANLSALVGDGVIQLSWSHSDIAGIASFNIFRGDSAGTRPEQIGSVSSITFTDRDLQNNHEYQYQVSAVGKNGLEGSRSAFIKSSPAVYALSINSGEEYTTTRTISLTFTAPTTATLVQISNDDSLFTNSQWETFVAVRNWFLSFEDGVKTVYAKFRDGEDRETIQCYYDAIILDSQAIINQVTENSEAQVLSGGETIHFAVETNEPYGRAWVVVEQSQTQIELYDDGTNGDLLPADGIYETDYHVPFGPREAEGSLVAGHFVDRAGNIAPPLDAPGRITIRRPPVPVDLISVAPVVSSSTALNLFWTKSADADFASYRIFRALKTGVNAESPLVTIIQDEAALSYADTNLVSNATYFYRIYVFDISGLSAASNELSGKTNE
jgi:hypothetical protein